MTGNIAILWPMIVQAFLTLAIYPVLISRRRAALRAPKVEVADEEAPVTAPAPDRSEAAVRSIASQFELPVLFHVVCLALFVTNGASWFAVVLAWIFAVSRIAHAVVHLGTNELRLRLPAFLVGFAVVAVLWIVLALHIADVGRALGAAGAA